MKHNIIFSVHIIIVIFIGLLGSYATQTFLKDNSYEETTFPKSSNSSDAVYLSAQEENPFDIMSFVDTDTLAPLNTYNDIYIGEVRLTELVEIFFKYLSRYSEETAFSAPADKKISESIFIDDKRNILIKEFKYYNPLGELRCFDFLYNAPNSELVYINFYDNKKSQLKGSEIEKSLNRMDSYVSGFVEGLRNEFSDYDFYGYLSNMLDNNDTPDLFIDCGSQNKEEQLNKWNNSLSSLTSVTSYENNSDIDNPLLLFLVHFAIPSSIEMMNYQYMSVFFTNNIIYKLENRYYEEVTYGNIETTDPFHTTYASYNGRIYQTLQLYGRNKVTIIYNLKSNIVEGLISESSSFIHY